MKRDELAKSDTRRLPPIEALFSELLSRATRGWSLPEDLARRPAPRRQRSGAWLGKKAVGWLRRTERKGR